MDTQGREDTVQGKALTGRETNELAPWMAGALCGRITFQSGPVPALRKSLSPRGTGKGLLCVMDGDNARKCMYGKVSRNKHQVHPKSTREGHLLCVTLAGSDREKQLT